MRTFYVGIDVGTFYVKVVIAAPAENPDAPLQIIGTGTAVSKGLRNGYIIDKSDAAKSIREAVLRAQSSAKVVVRSARLSLGGVGLDEIRSTGDVTLTQSGGVVSDRDIERALQDSEKRASPKLVNRIVLHTIPLEYRVDGSKVLGKPAGLQGTKLSVDSLLVTTLTQHHDDMIEAVEAAGVEVESVMAAPLAASLVTLTKSQKVAGVCLANIGAETLSVIVFDNDTPVSLKVFPLGSGDITNAIALQFQLSLTEAEQTKRGGVTGSELPAKKIDTIVSSKMKEMFTLINDHLKSIGRQRLLPAGIVLTGGGSNTPSAPDIARTILKLPSQVGQVSNIARTASTDGTWVVAYGLCRWAYAEDSSHTGHTVSEVLAALWDALRQGIRSLLP